MTPTATDAIDAAAFLTDAGLETSLIHDHGLELPDFAAFPLVDSPAGRAVLLEYYERYVRIAAEHGLGVVLETATWRAGPDGLARQALPADDLARLNARAVALLLDLRRDAPVPVVVSGCVGPRFDGYAPERAVSVAEALDYHRVQVAALAGAGADVVSALTMTSVDEAVGITLACREAEVPAVVSFTVETDGRLPDGTALDLAVRLVDEATGAYPSYFMVNCAHPDHLAAVLGAGGEGIERIRGLRCNASRLSHAELDEATELDAGDPDELAGQYVALRAQRPQLTIWGGCCGTNHEHVAALAAAIRS